LLEYISKTYEGQYWHALPREVAEHCAAMKPRHTPLVRRRVCMISFSAYESDNRVIRYAEALGRRGDTVDAVAVSRRAGQPNEERIGHVNVHRVQFRGRKDHQKKVGYLLPLLRFWAASSWWLCRNHLRKRYDLIHVHNVPDFLVFSAWLPKLTGAKVILDIHDIVPEFYASKFHLQPDSIGVRMLKLIERMAATFADHVIISNHLWYEKLVSRSCPREKCSAVINHVDSHIFYPRKRTRTDGKFIIIFPGGLQWHQGLDIAIRAFARIANRVPGVEFHMYGDGNMRDELIELARSLNLNGQVQFHDPLPIADIATVMANADLGVVPKRADSFGNEAYSTKIMEFMSLGVPVVISRTKIDSFYFNETVARFFESGNEEALAQAMLEMIEKKEMRQKLITNAFSYVAQNNWETKRAEYFNLVDTLTPPKAPRS
jgi:glycosyltransferase involved in cell wall biosynthesis